MFHYDCIIIHFVKNMFYGVGHVHRASSRVFGGRSRLCIICVSRFLFAGCVHRVSSRMFDGRRYESMSVVKGDVRGVMPAQGSGRGGLLIKQIAYCCVCWLLFVTQNPKKTPPKPVPEERVKNRGEKGAVRDCKIPSSILILFYIRKLEVTAHCAVTRKWQFTLPNDMFSIPRTFFFL